MKTKQLFISLLSLVVILSGISLADAAGVWKNPKAAPPLENVDAPINVGTIAQDKAGVLRVTGFRSFFDAIIDTKLQVGTTATMPSNLKLLTAGKVGAEAYCDQNGLNCVTSSGIPVVGGSSNTSSSGNISSYSGSFIVTKGENAVKSQDTGISSTQYPNAVVMYTGTVTGGSHEGRGRLTTRSSGGRWFVDLSPPYGNDQGAQIYFSALAW